MVHPSVPHIEAEERSTDGAERGEHYHPLARLVANIFRGAYRRYLRYDT